MVDIDLLAWEGPPIPWTTGSTLMLSRSLPVATRQIDDYLQGPCAEWALMWDPALGDPPTATVEHLTSGRADAWHSGCCFGLAGLPEDHDVIHPVWSLARDPGPDTDGVSWRLSLAALLVRTEAFRTVGGLDPAFEGATGAGLELGRRLIDRGAVVFHTPTLVNGQRRRAEDLSEHDRFVFLRRVFGPKWVHYAAARRVLARPGPLRVAATIRSLRSSTTAVTATPRPGRPDRVVQRPPRPLPADPRVSVILPTLGRYELLRTVLGQLCRQTIRPVEIIVVDQNDPAERDPDFYRPFAACGVRVVFQDGKGQWLARNAALAEARGDWMAFVDDDSEVADDFIEAHLGALTRYDADLSTGASLAVVGAPVPDNYGFFRVADQFDSGNGMCHRSLLERIGTFDEQFDRQRRGDAEFGLRTQLAGGLVIHSPDAVRVHLKSATGGLRTFGSWDGFRHRNRTAPLPLPSMIYYTRRFHTPRQVREDLIIGIAQAIVPYHLKRRATPSQWVGFAATELVHLRSTVRRVRRSLLLADAMVEAGPRIPPLAALNRGG